MKATRPAKVTQEEIDRSIDERIAGANDARLDRLEVLHSFAAVRHRTQQAELERLKGKYGAGDARVAEAEARVAITGAGVRSLGLEVERSNLTRPQVQKDRYLVFGLVRDANDKPQDNVLVQLVDDNGTAVTPQPEQTDGHGAFRVELPIAAAQTKTKAAAEAAARGTTTSTVRVEVLSAKGKRLALDPIALRPRAGVVEYREIVLGARPLKKTQTRGK